MSDPLSEAEAKELIRLCEAGRLYEVEAWIRAGKSIAVPAGIRKTPLKVTAVQISRDTGRRRMDLGRL
jgi:hypothetical protein